VNTDVADRQVLNPLSASGKRKRKRERLTMQYRKFGKGLGSVDPEYGYAWYAGI
jgi:hypothetical protein